MADRRRQIAALRAKAASTTFPAEAEACRAKADELEALEPKRESYEPHPLINPGAPGTWHIRIPTTQPGDLWSSLGNVQVRVTNVQGNTYTIWVE